MSFCSICPRKCSIDRAESAGYCGAREKAHIARAALHCGEESSAGPITRVSAAFEKTPSRGVASGARHHWPGNSMILAVTTRAFLVLLMTGAL